MEDELDIRLYIEILKSKWHWIIGGAVVAGIVAFVVSTLLPPSYEATALVVVTQPTEIVEFDARIRSVDDAEPIIVLPEIAVSDMLMLAMLPEVNAMDTEISSVEDVRRLLEATSGKDASLLRLTVTHNDSEKTSAIANLWTELFVTHANQIYGNIGGAQLEFYERKAEEAANELKVAEDALVEFQSRNRTSILANQLSSLRQIQSDYLDEQRQIILLAQDVQALRDQLAKQDDDVDITFADQLVSLSLQSKIFDVEDMPVQLQWESADGLVNSDRSDQVDYLDALLETLSVRAIQVDEALLELEPQILLLQTDKQKGDTESVQVQRNYVMAYTALNRRVEEEKITSQDVNSLVKVISSPLPPDKPISPKRLTNTVLAMVVGLMVGVGVVFLMAWYEDLYTPYHDPQQDQQAEREHSPKNGVPIKTTQYAEHK